MKLPRIYDSLLVEHLANHRQMAFVGGPRQVGKTATCRLRADICIDWDDIDDRERVLAGPGRFADRLKLDRPSGTVPVVLFDGLHRFPRWKQFLKGFFDVHADRVRVVATGDSRMDVHRGGGGLTGRYFSYRMHPFSVAETVTQELPDSEWVVRPPRQADDFDVLWRYGGYPEPFIKRDARFSRRWRSLRFEQLARNDIRDFTRVQQLGQIEVMVRWLSGRSGQKLVYGNLAKQVRVAVDTVRRWVAALCDLHLGFIVRPWFKSVPRSLRKEPKWYLRDWASIGEPASGPRLSSPAIS